MFAKRAPDFRKWVFASLRLLSRRFDFLQDFDHACAAFDRIVEVKNEMRRVFQNDVAREVSLQNGTVLFEFSIAVARPSPKMLT